MRTNRRFALLAAAGLFLAAICPMPGAVYAQRQRLLDEELIEDLGADPVDDFDRQLFGPADRPDREKAPAEADLPDRPGREPGSAAVAKDDHPLAAIARRMRQVEKRIGSNDSGKTTQGLQDQVVADLNGLIDQARKACKKCCSGGGKPQGVAGRGSVGQPSLKPGGGRQPSNRPATTSSRRPQGNGHARKVDLDRMREVIKSLWGELPPHEREMMLQLPVEEFLPKYERLIEEYFRRLSEEDGRPGRSP